MKNGNQDFSAFFENCSHAMENYSKLHIDAVRQLSQLQLDFINLYMECNCSQLERLAKAETPADVMATESGVATEYTSKFFNTAQQTFNALNRIQEDMLSLLQDSNMMFQPDTASESRRKEAKKSAAPAE